jgi:hypothetical protein
MEETEIQPKANIEFFLNDETMDCSSQSKYIMISPEGVLENMIVEEAAEIF